MTKRCRRKSKPCMVSSCIKLCLWIKNYHLFPRHRKKKDKRQRSRGRDSGGSGTENDSRRGSGYRFRALRLFSSDFDGAIGRDIAVLFHSNEADQSGAPGAGGPVSSTAPPSSQTAHLPTPEIKINPPSHQTSPESSRKNSTAAN